MKKKIIIIIAFLFFSSFLIVLLLGRKATIEYIIEDAESISIDYDKSIIKCDYEINNNKLKIDILPIKKGHTDIVIMVNKKNTDSNMETTEYRKNVYVHFMNIISLNRFLGNVNGDISVIIAFLISLVIIMLYVIRQFIRGIRKNLYEYRNIRLLGLLIFIGIIFAWHFYTFVIDTINNYYMSIYIFIQDIKTSSMMFSSFMLPIAIIITIILTISNIILVMREGKTWKNMLGVILGGFICLSTLLLIIYSSSFTNSKDFTSIIINGISFLISIGITYLECILFGTIIIGLISAKHIPKYDKDYIIILGCKIKGDGTLLPLIKSRVDKAIEFSKKQKEKTGKSICFVPSGGKGNDEIISEADAMKNYLIEQGISQKQIIIENKSTNTYENIKFSNKIITKENKQPVIAFCTSNYHVFRAGNIASNQGIYIEGIGAKTKTYYWINAFIREFVATLVSEKNKHIKILIEIMISFFIIYCLSHISMFL